MTSNDRDGGRLLAASALVMGDGSWPHALLHAPRSQVDACVPAAVPEGGALVTPFPSI
jgi:hypothetical protein